MISTLIKKIKKLRDINFRFDLPQKKNILQYDDLNSNILQKSIKKNFNILQVREKKEIYFWILLKQLVFLNFKLITYYKNYIIFTSPKIIITTTDNNIQFYELKKFFKNINFISIQNGLRLKYWFEGKNFKKNRNLSCDHMFVYNKYVIGKYKKIIKSNYHILGSFKNNMIKLGKSKTYDQFLYISAYGKNQHQELFDFNKKLLISINLYLSQSRKKIHILVRNKSFIEQKDEIDFYKKIFHSNCILHKGKEWDDGYKILDKFRNIIFTHSTLGYEAIARKKKVAIFSHKKHKNFEYYFGWPAPYNSMYNFFSAKNLKFNEVKRVLDNIYNCNQTYWEKKYYQILKDQMYINFNNKKLVTVINNILDNHNKLINLK